MIIIIVVVVVVVVRLNRKMLNVFNKKVKRQTTEGIELSNQENTGTIGEKKTINLWEY